MLLKIPYLYLNLFKKSLAIKVPPHANILYHMKTKVDGCDGRLMVNSGGGST